MRFRHLLPAALLLASPAGGRAHQVASGHKVRLPQLRSEMVVVPGGTFLMGADDAELANAVDACRDEFGQEGSALCDQMRSYPESYFGQSRTVYLSPFEIDRFEVTVASYRHCVAARACDLVPLVSCDTRFIQDDLPMVNVTWFEARDYCAWQGKRLPTEAEWEKAARGVDARRWPWGNTDGPDRANRGMVQRAELGPILMYGDVIFSVDESDGAKVMAPPGTFRWGKSPYGIYDMSGNVSEWTADWWSPTGYANLSRVDPHGARDGLLTRRVIRGGGFDTPRLWARTYFRGRDQPTLRSIGVGFRCARDAD
jgi:formylglycine-generating enzyme required for sulfatase activity